MIEDAETPAAAAPRDVAPDARYGEALLYDFSKFLISLSLLALGALLTLTQAAKSGEVQLPKLFLVLGSLSLTAIISFAVGHALVAIEAARRGLGRLALDEGAAMRDLTDAWEVLGEAVQVVMRRYDLPDSYEQLKDLSRGRPLTRDVLHQFIAGLALPTAARDYLLALTPSTYIGIAPHAVRHVL